MASGLVIRPSPDPLPLPSSSDAGSHVENLNRRRPTFLDLPKQARTTIYSLCLIRPCPIDLWSRRNPEDEERATRVGWRPECWYRRQRRGFVTGFAPGDHLCNCPPLPLALTLVCRQVHNESLDVFFGYNLFVLKAHNGHQDALWPLLHMPGHHLSRMRRLFIRLNRWPCPEGHDSDRCGVASDGTPPSPAYCFLCKSPLSESPTANLDMLSGWRSLCRRLGWERTPGLMNLTVIYDAEDEARAREITDPLIEFLPRLRTCNLRLGSSPAMEGQARLARRTVLALTGREPGPQINEPFPFNKLPWELKLRILEHTHLGTSQTGDYNIFFTRVNVINGRFIKGRLYPESCWRITCCGKCCDSVMDCCCISSYAAYSATCQCRVLPLAVFQVSRDFRLAAQQVFYHNAQFCVRNDQLESAFNFVSGPTLSLLRNVSLAMTPAQCYFWPGYCPATAHPQWDFERSVEIYFPMGPYVSESIDPATSTTWPYTYQAPSVGFRTALDILATVDYNDTDDRNEEPPPLDLEKDLVALWIYAGLYMTPGGDDDTEDLEQRFGWVYDLYLDIAHAIHQAFFATPDQGQGKKRRRLGSVNFQLVIFKDLAPWLAREVLGDSFSGNVEDVEDAWEGRRARPRRPIHEKVPSYHSVEYLGGGRQLVRPSRWG